MSAAMRASAGGSAGLLAAPHGRRGARRPVVARRPVRAPASSATPSSADDDASCALRTRDETAAEFRFEGTRRLYGDRRFEKLATSHVAVLGMGGVGSWTAEALARSGVGALTLVDLDVVCVTNVNRQVLATDASVGASKADTMAARVRDINPLCDVTIVRDFVSEENVEAILGLENLNRNRRDDVPYKTIDFVVDAIDAERDKAAVIACCVHHRVPVITVGGAGGVDALGDVVVEDLSRATFNRLCQRVRRLLRRDYAFPRGEERTPREIYGVKKSSFKKGNEGDSKRETKARGKGRKKPQGKFGVKAVYHRENVNFFKPDPGTRGRGGMGCDGVGGSAVFVTGALGFKAASHVCLALMDDDTKDDSCAAAARGPAASGWRSRVWPKGRGERGERGERGGGGGEGAPGLKASLR